MPAVDATEHLKVSIGGERWVLGQRAAYWIERRWLVIADVHFGKAATFRARGVPVPHGTTSDNLRRIDALIDRLEPEAVIVLGDFLHAREAQAPGTLQGLRAWRERRAGLDVVLVEGNHDRSAGALPASLRIDCVAEPWQVGGFAFCHQPRFIEGSSVLAGHLHPAIRLSGRADDGVSLPCYWLRRGLAVLPAFGDFTGGARIDREVGDRVIALADDRLFEVPQPRAA
jgi:uncharacterized protein